jgi:tetratricopeptide (TPR) repeat protein
MSALSRLALAGCTVLVVAGSAAAKHAPAPGYEPQINGLLDRHEYKQAQSVLAAWKAHKGEADPQYWVAAANLWANMGTHSTIELSSGPPNGKDDGLELKSDDGKVAGSIHRGPTTHDADKFRRAIGFLDEAIKRFPQRLDLYVGRSDLYRTIPDLDGELAALTSLARDPHPATPDGKLERAPGQPLDMSFERYAVDMLNAYSREHFEQESPEGDVAGVAVARLLVRLYPKYPQGYNLLALAASLKKDWPEARKQLELALVQAPDDVLVIGNLGYCAEQMGDKAGAIARYRRVLELDRDPDESARAKERLEALGKPVTPPPAKK